MDQMRSDGRHHIHELRCQSDILSMGRMVDLSLFHSEDLQLFVKRRC